MNIERIGNSLATATPLIMTGLAVAFAFNTGLFNIGASGQMLIGGLCATAVGLTLVLPKLLLLPLMLLSALAGGALWGLVPGFLKAKFNVHEVVATIMMNWIAYWTVYYSVSRLLQGPLFRDGVTENIRGGLPQGSLADQPLRRIIREHRAHPGPSVGSRYFSDT